MIYSNHYEYLEAHLSALYEALGLDYSSGIIIAHGDKAYGYRHKWEKGGLHFYHGVAIFLLTYENPYSKEVRETNDGWVDTAEWVLKNKDRFLKYLPEVDCG